MRRTLLKVRADPGQRLSIHLDGDLSVILRSHQICRSHLFAVKAAQDHPGDVDQCSWMSVLRNREDSQWAMRPPNSSPKRGTQTITRRRNGVCVPRSPMKRLPRLPFVEEIGYVSLDFH